MAECLRHAVLTIWFIFGTPPHMVFQLTLSLCVCYLACCNGLLYSTHALSLALTSGMHDTPWASLACQRHFMGSNWSIYCNSGGCGASNFVVYVDD